MRLLARTVYFSAVLVSAALALRGVSPDREALYKPDANGLWHCLLDPSVVIRADQLNDDICDCPDGSDEPGTNACPYRPNNIGFYCANKGFKPAYIENYKVDDQVCDYDLCCDGSDEQAGLCPDKCAQVQAQYEEYMASQRKVLDQALQIKDQLKTRAAELRKEVEAKWAKKQELVQGARARLLHDEGTQAPPLAQVSEHQQSIQNQFALMAEQLQASEKAVQFLEKTLKDLLENYNPNFNDYAVKQAVNTFADYLSNKPEKAAPKEFNLEDALQHLAADHPKASDKPSVTGLVAHYHSVAKSYFGDKPQAPSAKLPEVPAPELTTKTLGHSNTQKQLEDLEIEERIYADNLARDYGEDDILRTTEDHWVTLKLAGYTYKFMLLSAVYQDSTLVGRFDRIEGLDVYFLHGSKCWNGPQRSAVMSMVCGVEQRLVLVSEPEKCHYRFVLETPLACRSLGDDKIAESFSVDITQLQ